MNPEMAVQITTQATLGTLSNGELVQLGLKLSLGRNPRELPFFGKVRHLFTTTDDQGFPKMHSVVENETHSYITNRLKEAINAAD